MAFYTEKNYLQFRFPFLQFLQQPSSSFSSSSWLVLLHHYLLPFSFHPKYDRKNQILTTVTINEITLTASLAALTAAIASFITSKFFFGTVPSSYNFNLSSTWSFNFSPKIVLGVSEKASILDAMVHLLAKNREIRPKKVVINVASNLYAWTCPRGRRTKWSSR